MSAPQDKGSCRHGARAEAWLDRHACQGGRLSWSARPGSSGMALTRSARSGDCRVSWEVGLPATLPYERRQPTRVDGPCRARPRESVGLPPLPVRPVRGPGFTPPSLSTRNLLQRRNMEIESVACELCILQVEQIATHLFLHCNFARRCWNFIGVYFDLSASPLQSLEQIRSQLPQSFAMEIIIILSWTV